MVSRDCDSRPKIKMWSGHGAQTSSYNLFMNIRSNGFTLIELLLGLVLLGVVSAIAVPVYTNIVEGGREAAAISDIMRIEMAIDRFNGQTFTYPGSLDEISNIPRQDPWGRDYEYFLIDGSDAKGIKGKQRKDKNLNPLNTDYDLYSLGKDGISKLPLTAKASHDDIVRAGNGGFVGRAEDH